MEKIYEIIERDTNPTRASNIYDALMILTVIFSVSPLLFKADYPIFHYIDIVTVVIFIIDYILRLITSNHKLHRGKLSYLIYPFTPFAIIDLLSILPSMYLVHPAFKLFRILRVFKAFRILKTLRFSRNFDIIIHAISAQLDILISIFIILLGYIFVSAIIMFNAEPSSFKNFFDAVYWSVTMITTVGYGDIYPISLPGKIVSMTSSIFGIAMIALPSGVITAGILAEANRRPRPKNTIEAVDLNLIHTTKLGEERIKRNIKMNISDVVGWCKDRILDPNAHIVERGKNWYVFSGEYELVINTRSHTIITVHKNN